MGVKTDLEQVRRAVGVTRDQLWDPGEGIRGALKKIGSPIRFYRMGVDKMAEELLELLETGPYQDADADLESAIRSFCYDHCTRSRRHQPGTHLHCRRCPLREHAITRLDKAAEDAAKEDE